MSINIFLIGFGGALGAISRYLINGIFSAITSNEFPFATLSVNVIGCFLIGLVLGLTLPYKDSTYYFFIIGFLGSFTTMSAFSHQVLLMLNSNSIYAVSYIIMTIILTILATYIGASISK